MAKKITQLTEYTNPTAIDNLVVVDNTTTPVTKKITLSGILNFFKNSVKLDQFLAPDDITDLNASESAHGLLPKLSGDNTQFLNGEGVFSTPNYPTSSLATTSASGLILQTSTVAGQKLISDGTNQKYIDDDAQLTVILGNGVNVLSTGVKGFIEVPVNCVIESVRLVADVSNGSAVIDIWKDTYSNFPPTVADTITASAKPTLSSAQKAEDSTLTGWTKTLSKGDWLAFNVDSASTLKQVTLSINVRKTATS